MCMDAAAMVAHLVADIGLNGLLEYSPVDLTPLRVL